MQTRGSEWRNEEDGTVTHASEISLSHFFHAILLGATSLLTVPAAMAADPPVMFVVRATANEAKLGYTAGQKVEFKFTINPDFVETTSSSFDESFATWKSMERSEAFAFSSIEGTELHGAFLTGDKLQTFLVLGSGGTLSLHISLASATGLLVNGAAVYGIVFQFGGCLRLWGGGNMGQVCVV